MEVQSTNKEIFPLRMAVEGEKVRIVLLRGGKNFCDRLSGMGLNVGSEIEIIQNRKSGKMLVSCEESRFFMGGGMAHKIDVEMILGEIR